MNNIVNLLESNMEYLQNTKFERIEQKIKEKKLNLAYESLNEYKKQAEEEIQKNGTGSKEANSDLEQINEEIEKVKSAITKIEKDVEDEIKTVKRDLARASKISSQKEQVQMEMQENGKAIEMLLKNKEEAEEEIRSNGAGSKEAERDLERIEEELNTRYTAKEESEKKVKKFDLQLQIINEKYRDSIEEQLNFDWEAAIKENEEFDKQKRLNEAWEEAIKENEEFDRNKQICETARKEIEEYDKKKLEEDWDLARRMDEEFGKGKKQEQQSEKNDNVIVQSQVTPKVEPKIEPQTKPQTRIEPEKETKPETTPERRNIFKNNVKNNHSIVLTYIARDKDYVIKNKDVKDDKGKKAKIRISELTDIEKQDKEAIAIEKHKKVEDLENVDTGILSALNQIDEKYNLNKAEAYFNVASEPQKYGSSVDIENYMERNKLRIVYDLRGIYDKPKNEKMAMTPEERKAILEMANKANKLGVAEVRKGIKVTVLEAIDNLKDKMSNRKNTKLLEEKNQTQIDKEKTSVVDKVSPEVQENLAKVVEQYSENVNEPEEIAQVVKDNEQSEIGEE